MSEKEDSSSTSKSILAPELEELFKHRYSDEDSEYMKLKQTPLPAPPIVCPFEQIRQRRNRDRNFDRRSDHRRRDERHFPHWGYNDRRDRSTSWDRNSNLERGGYRDRNSRERFSR